MALGARQVGEFMPSRTLIRTARNPLDKCTVISIYPLDFDAIHETTDPRNYHIPRGTYENPSTTIIGPSAWVRDMGAEQPQIEVQTSSIQVAHSIVHDFSVSMLGCDMEGAKPGLFFAVGEVSPKDVKTRFTVELAAAEAKQKNWYMNLVKLADALWARMNGNPLVIWDVMRLAARELGLEKPWLKDYTVKELVKCFACGALRNPEYPICGTCKSIDQKHPLAKDIKFAV